MAQEGRQRPAGRGRRSAGPPRAGEPGARPGSRRRGCPLSHCLPSALGALSLSSGLEQPLPGRGFITRCQAPGSLWEPSRAVQPAESGPEHWVRITLLGPPVLPLPHPPGKVVSISELVWMFLVVVSPFEPQGPKRPGYLSGLLSSQWCPHCPRKAPLWFHFLLPLTPLSTPCPPHSPTSDICLFLFFYFYFEFNLHRITC